MKNILSVPALEFLVLSGHAGYNLDIDVTKGPLVSVAKTDFYEIVKAVYANGGDEVVNGLIKYTSSKDVAFQLEFVKSFYGVRNVFAKAGIERIPYDKNTWLTGTGGRVLVDRNVLFETLKVLNEELDLFDSDIESQVPGSYKVFSVLGKNFKKLFKLTSGDSNLQYEKEMKHRVRMFFEKFQGKNLVISEFRLERKEGEVPKKVKNFIVTGKNESKRCIYGTIEEKRVSLNIGDLEDKLVFNLRKGQFINNFPSFQRLVDYKEISPELHNCSIRSICHNGDVKKLLSNFINRHRNRTVEIKLYNTDGVFMIDNVDLEREEVVLKGHTIESIHWQKFVENFKDFI